MLSMKSLIYSTVATFALASTGTAIAQDQFTTTAEQVNKKMVKLFGSGGFKGLASYGTGLVISPEGHVLTVASPLLDTQSLRVHLYDGRRFDNVKTLVTEPLLDLAILKIEGVKDLPYFDITEAAKHKMPQTGDWVLGFSNQFQIATRDEPMSVQRGVISAYSKLHGRRGVHEAPYTGDVYVIDAITNNPGAGGGALTTRKGELLGIIGKELRNTLTDTWINYAVPVTAKIDVQLENEKRTVTLLDFVEKGMQGKWKQIERPTTAGGPRGYHGIVLVPDVVERTPPFVEDVRSNSPAAKAGLKPDDLIVYVNGEQVSNVKVFHEIINRSTPGAEVVLEVRRGDRLTTIKMKMGEPQTAKSPK